MTITDELVSDVLREMGHVSEPEREDGKCPTTKAGWIRAVLTAASRSAQRRAAT